MNRVFLFSICLNVFLVPLSYARKNMAGGHDHQRLISATGVGPITSETKVDLPFLFKLFPENRFDVTQGCGSGISQELDCYSVTEKNGRSSKIPFFDIQTYHDTGKPYRIDTQEDILSPANVHTGSSYEDLIQNSPNIQCQKSTVDGIVNCFQETEPHIIYEFDVSEFSTVRLNRKPLDRTLLKSKKMKVYWSSCDVR